MTSTTPPDAILVHNNVMTQGAMLAQQDLGVRWPEQVDVTGFGVFSQAGLYRPPLTLVAQPTRQMGERAVDLLVNRLQDGAQDWVVQIVLPNRVVTREDWLKSHAQMRAGALPIPAPIQTSRVSP
jgi:LacI family transcriptional regulator